MSLITVLTQSEMHADSEEIVQQAWAVEEDGKRWSGTGTGSGAWQASENKTGHSPGHYTIQAMMNVPRDGQTKTNGLQQKKLSSNVAA